MRALLELILLLLDLYSYIIIAQVVLSWLVNFNVVNTSNRIVYAIGEALWKMTEPALRPIRRFLPAIGGLDLSPIVLLLLIWFIQRLIVTEVAPALL